MKKKFILMTACALCLVACDKKSGSEVTTDKEGTLQQAVTPYVNNTVIATYSNMADAGLTLLEQTEQLLDQVSKDEDYSATKQAACASWRLMRKYWEQSEAFLYGPAAAHNIDPHIDSWPLDFNAMNALLNNAAQMAQIEAEGGAYVGDKLGYALKGFHAAEYLLFKLPTLTHAQAVYLYGIVEDLTQQAILLEYCWAGEVSATKAKVLEDGEVDTFEDLYGWQMKNAGKAGSTYKTYQDAAEEIIAGCVDIAGEVADLKMGNPYISSTDEERDYIESPYSCTSTIDFADNIRSIRNAYCGAQTGDASISDFVKSKDSQLDAEVRNAIDKSIQSIDAIQNFETSAKGNPQVKAAMDQVSALEELLDKEVLPLLSK